MLQRKKVIASTDVSLIGECTHLPCKEHPQGLFKLIPKIRESVLRAFIEDYNKGKKWEWVNVEYEELFNDPTKWNGEKVFDIKLKLRSDNTVIIHPVKDVFTREEVHDILHEYGSANCPNPYYKGRTQAIYWFNENY